MLGTGFSGTREILKSTTENEPALSNAAASLKPVPVFNKANASAHAASLLAWAKSFDREYLVFDYQKVSLFDKSGKCLLTVPASSGAWPVYMSRAEKQNVLARGPIPEGTYFIDPRGWVKKSFWQELKFGYERRLDFGMYYVYMEKGPGNRTFRSGLFLHGGLWPGSKGCVDCGRSVGKIYRATASLKGPIPFVVYSDFEVKKEDPAKWKRWLSQARQKADLVISLFQTYRLLPHF